MNLWQILFEGRSRRLITYPPVGIETIDHEIELSRQDRERIERLLETVPDGPTGHPIADIMGGRQRDNGKDE